MKFIHLSDLHLGKHLNGYSLLEDQNFILEQILGHIDREQPQAVLLSGDLYDKPVPPVEAVKLLDDFLVALSDRGIRVLAISGNHDSAERVSFGSRLMGPSGIHFAPAYNGFPQPIVLADSHGPVYFWPIPFLKPSAVRARLGDDGISSYTDALQAVIGQLEIDTTQRNVLLAHQFVTNAQVSDSEIRPIGGLDNVDGWVFDPFDYVALGHLHRPQSLGRETLRYCGTPLKYSFSEIQDEKSVTVVELEEKGQVLVRTIPLKPLRDLRKLRGTIDALLTRANYAGTNTDDYVYIVLTDRNPVPSAMARLQNVYSHAVELEYESSAAGAPTLPGAATPAEQKTPLQWAAAFYSRQCGQEMQKPQLEYCQRCIESIQEEQL